MSKVEVIDRKFVFTGVNPCNGNIYTQDNAVLFCAHDQALPACLEAYYRECKRIKCDSSHLKSIKLLRQRVIKFQMEVKSKVPDTNTVCEINRCIKGEFE